MRYKSFNSQREFLQSLLNNDAYVIDGKPLYLNQTSKLIRFVWGDHTIGLGGLLHFELLANFKKVQCLITYPSNLEL